MTIAISLKVDDGVILASDSATSLIVRDHQGRAGVANIYNTANKVFNLRKGLPVGAITWGAGSIGNASISTLIKDLRKRFSGELQQYKIWHIDSDSYTIQSVADKLKEYIYDELYVPEFQSWQEKPTLGFIVAGYSSNEGFAEEYQIDIVNGICSGPKLIRPKNDSGATWSGEPEAINRLMFGMADNLPEILIRQVGVPPPHLPIVLNEIKQACSVPLVMPAMPMQDAIDLAEFLIDLTIKFSRFNMGAPTVGGPIEIAAITKHEGFKWVKRKHYFHKELNRECT